MGYSIWYKPRWRSIKGKLHVVKNIQPTDYGPDTEFEQHIGYGSSYDLPQ
jgi:hypothetical protein